MRVNAECTGEYTVSVGIGENLKKPQFFDIKSSNELCCIKLS